MDFKTLNRRNFLIVSAATTAGLVTIPAQAAYMHPLEQKIESYIKGLRRKGIMTGQEKTSWSVYDFKAGKKLVTINEDTPRQAASLIKPLIALAFFHKVKQGRISYSNTAKWHMEAMIQHSNNESTNWVMKQVGGPKNVNAILTHYYSGKLQDTAVKEYIPSGGRTYLNKASAHDYSRFLYALWNNQLPYSQEIRRLMALPNRDRVYDDVPEIPKGTNIYDKTGSTAMLCGQMAIVSALSRNGKRYPYTFIAIIERTKRTNNYATWISSRADIVRNVSGIVYTEMKKYYNLI